MIDTSKYEMVNSYMEKSQRVLNILENTSIHIRLFIKVLPDK